MMKRIWATFYARNLEFLRDRATLGWNLLLPFLLVIGLALVFSGGANDMFKVAVIADVNMGEDKKGDSLSHAELNQASHPFLATRYVEFYPVSELQPVIKKVARHQVDMLLDLRADQMHYWVNSDSPNGYVLEQLLQGSNGQSLTRQQVTGDEIRYVDWVVPGVLGMNIMFSCLFGVGFVIVRYRKNGYLKRLNASPLTAMEFLVAQVLSRLVLVVATTALIFFISHLIMDFVMEGSYLTLLLVLLAGTFSMISLGLLVAARVSSEELAGGLLNVLTWPMMILSGVWFSMEGAHPALQWVSQLSPLTHMLSAARAIMLDGAGLLQVGYPIGILLVMGLVFLALGAYWFKWSAD